MMTQTPAEMIQEMDKRYRLRIANQVAIIERLQGQIHDRDRTITDLTLERDQLKADVAALKKAVDHNAAAMPQPEAVWDRRVPEEPRTGPSESTSDEVLPFDAFSGSSHVPGEIRPPRTV